MLAASNVELAGNEFKSETKVVFVSGHVGISSTGAQPPTSNAVANGPVTGLTTSPQGHHQMGPQSAENSQRLSAPLSPGAVLANGPSSQSPVSNFGSPPTGNVQAGSAFTPVTSSHPGQPHSSPVPPLPGQPQPGFPVQGQSNVHQTQFGQVNNYTGQAQGLPPQAPGRSPQGTQPLSALHSNKPKRPVMPMNTGTGYPGQRSSPSPRSTPPPPVGPPGSAVTQQSTPPPPSNLPGSSMPQTSYSSSGAGYPPMGQDSQAGARPFSSRRRMYPTQVCLFE